MPEKELNISRRQFIKFTTATVASYGALTAKDVSAQPTSCEAIARLTIRNYEEKGGVTNQYDRVVDVPKNPVENARITYKVEGREVAQGLTNKQGNAENRIKSDCNLPGKVEVQAQVSTPDGRVVSDSLQLRNRHTEEFNVWVKEVTPTPTAALEKTPTRAVVLTPDPTVGTERLILTGSRQDDPIKVELKEDKDLWDLLIGKSGLCLPAALLLGVPLAALLLSKRNGEKIEREKVVVETTQPPTPPVSTPAVRPVGEIREEQVGTSFGRANIKRVGDRVVDLKLENKGKYKLPVAGFFLRKRDQAKAKEETELRLAVVQQAPTPTETDQQPARESIDKLLLQAENEQLKETNKDLQRQVRREQESRRSAQRKLREQAQQPQQGIREVQQTTTRRTRKETRAPQNQAPQ